MIRRREVFFVAAVICMMYGCAKKEEVQPVDSVQDRPAMTDEIPGDNVAFTTYFQDDAFAALVAEQIGKKKEDTVTTDELGKITGISGKNKGIRSVEGIEYLLNVISMNLDGNQLTKIPDEIGFLKKLKRFSAADNQLKTLPDGLGSVDILESLNINNNQISKIPESIGMLENLKVIYADNNQISSIPESIMGCVNLQKISLKKNGLTNKPSVLQQRNDLEVILK